MGEAENTNKSDAEPEIIPPIDEVSVPNKDGEDIIQNQHKTTNTSQNHNTKGSNVNPFVVKVDKSARITRQEIISILTILISGSLFFMTLKSFNQTKRAVDISEQNLKDARKKDSVAIIRNYISDSLDNIQRHISKIKDSVSKNNDSISMKLSQQALEAQIKYAAISESNYLLARRYAQKSDSNYIKSINIASNSLEVSKESVKIIQSNFEIENKSYVLFNNIKIDTLAINKPEQITVSVKNFGKTPILILYTKIGMMLDPSDNPKTLYYEKENIRYLNIFLSNGQDIALPYKSFTITPELFAPIMAGNIFLYVYGEVLYSDNTTGKTYSYVYCMRILSNARFAPTSFNNITYEIKDVPKEDKKTK